METWRNMPDLRNALVRLQHRFFHEELGELRNRAVGLIRGRSFGYERMKSLVEGKYGLEIGGPSNVFRPYGIIPLYDVVGGIDACNFSETTVWTSGDEARRFGRNLRKTFVSEASALPQIPENTYDFIAASHVLEHVANPLRALQEWQRVVRVGGTLLILVPDKRCSFDRRRPYTSFDHILQDYEAATAEDDQTHVPEILALHDLALDPGAGSQQTFEARTRENEKFRCIHHHIFSAETLAAMFDHLGLQIVNFAVARPFHIVVMARKIAGPPGATIVGANRAMIGDQAEWRRHDPLATLGNLP